MAASRLQLISKKLIKPSSPTPPSLRSYKISHMDQLTTDAYMSIASFYPSQRHSSSPSTTQISQLLENSLSKLLRSYYPFAGALTDNVSINCNDRGVTFSEARINCPMSAMLREHDASVQNILFPRLPWSHPEKENLVLAQLNHFDCGGKALAVCVSHKLGDGYTLTRFMSDWAAVSRQSSEEPSPQFIGESIFPPKDTSITPLIEPQQDECVAKRFSFDAKTIARLKELVAAESGVQNPTRVEIVTAFLYKSAVTASMVNSQSFKPSHLLLFVNLRRVIEPPLLQTSIGNIYSFFPTSIADEGNLKLSRLVSKLRRGKEEFYEKCERMKLNEIPSLTTEIFEDQMQNILQGADLYNCTSVCGFPSNHLDFGWGRPTRVALGSLTTKNCFMLMDDNNGDGVDAIVTLDEQVMSIFESDKEVREFASPNQSS